MILHLLYFLVAKDHKSTTIIVCFLSKGIGLLAMQSRLSKQETSIPVSFRMVFNVKIANHWTHFIATTWPDRGGDILTVSCPLNGNYFIYFFCDVIFLYYFLFVLLSQLLSFGSLEF